MNAEVLTLQTRVENTISLGKSHFREYKSAFENAPDKKVRRKVKHICADIAEALVAFANADGGELLVGVEDNGTITGIPHDEKEVQQMLKAVVTHTEADTKLPLIHSDLLNLDGSKVLFFAVIC